MHIIYENTENFKKFLESNLRDPSILKQEGIFESFLNNVNTYRGATGLSIYKLPSEYRKNRNPVTYSYKVKGYYYDENDNEVIDEDLIAEGEWHRVQTVIIF